MILSLMAAAQKYTPWLQIGNPAIWAPLGDYMQESSSGQTVTPDSALGLPAYYACIKVLSEDCAKLPIKIMRWVSDTKKEVLRAHPYVRLLNRVPNPNSTAITLREFLVAQCAGWGNGYWEILGNQGGKVTGFVPIRSELLQPDFDAAGNLIWRERTTTGETTYRGEQLIHLCGPTQNGYVGWSVAHYAAECLGTGLAQQKYAGAFFGNGAVPLVVLEHPAKVSPELRDQMRAAWESMHRGADNAHRTAILPENMKAHPLAVNPRDAQVIESRNFTIEEVCRWFRMPPSKIQHFFQAKGWDSSEAENQHYLDETLMSWLERIEAELDRKLFPDGEAFCEHDYSRMLRANAVARADYYTKMQTMGNFTINRVLAMEGEDDIGPVGDTRFVPVNLQPIDRAIEGPPEPQPAPAKPAPKDNDDDDDAPPKPPRSQLAWVLHTLERAHRKEAKVVARLAEKHAGDVGKYREEIVDFCEVFTTELLADLDPITREAAKAEHIRAMLLAFVSEAERTHLDPAESQDSIRTRERTVAAWAKAITAIAEG